MFSTYYYVLSTWESREEIQAVRENYVKICPGEKSLREFHEIRGGKKEDYFGLAAFT